MSDQAKGVLLALVGILILSPDTLLVRLLDMEQWNLQAWRGLGMAAALAAGMFAVYRHRAIGLVRDMGLYGVVLAACYATASILFVNALYLTSVANTLAIISTAPIWGALLSRIIIGERLPLRTWIAAAGCLVAVGIIVAGDLRFGHDDASLAGDALALAQSIFMAMGFVLIRKRSDLNTLPAVVLSGLFITVVSLAAGGSLAISAIEPGQGWLLALLVAVVLPLSFSMIFVAPRFIPAPEVNMIMLLEMILGPLMVWLAIGEAVPPATFAGGGLLFAILLAHSWAGLRNRPGKAVRRTGRA